MDTNDEKLKLAILTDRIDAIENVTNLSICTLNRLLVQNHAIPDGSLAKALEDTFGSETEGAANLTARVAQLLVRLLREDAPSPPQKGGRR